MGSNSLYGLTYDSTGSVVKKYVGVDKDDAGLVVIDTAHKNIHDGNTYSSSIVTGPVAAAGSFDVLIDGRASEAHMTFSVVGMQDSLITFRDTITASGSGTALTEKNMNRGSLNVADTEIYSNPVITDAGSALFTGFLASGASQGLGPGTGLIRTNTEWKLDKNTQYLIKVQNRGAAAGSIGVALEWYEVNH